MLQGVIDFFSPLKGDPTRFCNRVLQQAPQNSMADNDKRYRSARKVNLKKDKPLDTTKTFKLRYFDHIKRHQSIEKVILQRSGADGRGGRGGPRRR